jgi:hypothetical protein
VQHSALHAAWHAPAAKSSRCLAAWQAKLSMRSVPAGAGKPPASKPFLTFTCRGSSLSMVQDLPISRPHGPARARSLACPLIICSCASHAHPADAACMLPLEDTPQAASAWLCKALW